MSCLRKCSAIVNRDEASGVIVQRIIGSEASVVSGLNWILNSILGSDLGYNRPLTEAIEELGWPMVREIALTVLVHDLHAEIGPKIKMRPEDLDRRVLAVLSASSEVGGGPYASLFANIGELVMGIHEEMHGTIRRKTIITAEDVVRAEQDIFGFHHGALSAAMLVEVDFPSDVSKEVFEHPTVGTNIWTAEHLAADLGFRGIFDKGFQPVDLWPRLGLSQRRTERLRATILASTELPELAFADSVMEVA